MARKLKESEASNIDTDSKKAEIAERARRAISILTKSASEACDVIDLGTFVESLEDPELRPTIDRTMGEEVIEGLCEMLGIGPAFTSERPQLPEDIISSERQLLTDPEQKENLPGEVKVIVGDFPSFYAAMDYESGIPFRNFMKQSKKLKRMITPELLSEMLIIAAETNGEIHSFLENYNANSWHHAMSSHAVFRDFMAGWWFTQTNQLVEPKTLVHALLIVAAKASVANAIWFLDKAKRDEDGDPMYEEPAYILERAIGKTAFITVMKRAKETLDRSDGLKN